jgi:hypothetical protein
MGQESPIWASERVDRFKIPHRYRPAVLQAGGYLRKAATNQRWAKDWLKISGGEMG